MIALIPAKKNSSRIPGKNTLPLAGVPLFMHTAAYARLEGFTPVISTDSDKIIDLCKQHNLHFILEHPDETNLIHCIRNAFRAFPSTPALALLQPTSPFRAPAALYKAEQVFSATPARPLFSTAPRKLVGAITQGSLQTGAPSFSVVSACRDQDPATRFLLQFDGSFLFISRSTAFTETSLFPPSARPFLTRAHPITSLQIDTPQDFEMAAALAETPLAAPFLPLRGNMEIAVISNARHLKKDLSSFIDTCRLVIRINGCDSLTSGLTGARTDYVFVSSGLEYLARPREELHIPALRAAARVIAPPRHLSIHRDLTDLFNLHNFTFTPPDFALAPPNLGLTTFAQACIFFASVFPTATIRAIGNFDPAIRAPHHVTWHEKEKKRLHELINTGRLIFTEI